MKSFDVVEWGGALQEREREVPVPRDREVLLLTPKEVEYYRHGGILHYVLRQLAQQGKAA